MHTKHLNVLKGFFSRGLLCALVLVPNVTWAGTSERLPIPRFASLRSNEVNLRRGPGTQYPLDWIFVRAGLPVEIISEFETWRQIRDVEGTQGWVHQSMLSGKRTAMTMPSGSVLPLKHGPQEDARALALLEPGAQGTLLSCKGPWCRVQFGSYKGWLMRTQFWGVREKEEIK